MAKCKQCGVELRIVPGKVRPVFCGDRCRKAAKRAELKKNEAVAGPSVDELRTNGAKLPTSDSPSPDKTTTDSNIGQPKRGKDIKCFADLPPDVQQTIDKMSVVGGKIDKTIKANRTAIAVNYQHLFPGRYYPQDSAISSPVCIGKPGDADYDGICTPEWIAERAG